MDYILCENAINFFSMIQYGVELPNPTLGTPVRSKLYYLNSFLKKMLTTSKSYKLIGIVKLLLDVRSGHIEHFSINQSINVFAI